MANNKKSKYGAKKCVIGGIRFDSKKEASRWQVLCGMQDLGAISDLKRQVRFELIPKQIDPVTGRVLERACTYVADFTYYDADGNFVVEDSKGMKTDSYKIKKKLMLREHGVIIRET